MDKINELRIHNFLRVEYENKIFKVYHDVFELERLKNNNHIFIINDNVKKIIEKKLEKSINKNLILKLNFSTLPIDLTDTSFYHKHYTPYNFEEKEMINSAKRQWESQKIASKLNLAPEIFMTDYVDGLIYTIMEKIEGHKIEKITGAKNFNFAYIKRYKILKSLQKLHDHNVIHGDILTTPSIYTGQIHNIYYENNKVGFIDFGESRILDKNINNQDFEKWKKIEMDLISNKLLKKIDTQKMKEYLDIEEILKKNYNSNI